MEFQGTNNRTLKELDEKSILVHKSDLSCNDKKGAYLEAVVQAVGKYLGIFHNGTDIHPKYYKDNEGRIPDCVFKINGKYHAIECKNWQEGYTSLQRCNKLIIDRLKPNKTPKKASKWLAASFDTFSKKVRTVLKQEKIKVIAVGFQVNQTNYRKAFTILLKKLLQIIPNVGLSGIRINSIEISCLYSILVHYFTNFWLLSRFLYGLIDKLLSSFPRFRGETMLLVKQVVRSNHFKEFIL